MKFKNGSKVEVLCKPDWPAGSWRTAEIIYGNGQNYTVRYEEFMDATGEPVVEMVSRKAIRPCPPPREIRENWSHGDIVEVFVDLSWKMATVAKVLGNKCFLVRLIGSSRGFKVCKFDIRLRQCWEDGTWFVIGKASTNFANEECKGRPAIPYNLKSRHTIQQSNTRKSLILEDKYLDVKDNFKIQESGKASPKSLKRGFPCYGSQAAPNAGTIKKLRVVDKEGRVLQAIASNCSPLTEKVDTVFFPKKMPCENNINRMTGFTDIVMERENVNGPVACSPAVTLELNDEERCTSSVGSCSSTSNIPIKSSFGCLTAPDEDIDENISDAESSCERGYREGHCPHLTKKELGAKMHKLELDAYRCTMEALHSLGPMSWEHETMVTNLRVSLNISNDEHLRQAIMCNAVPKTVQRQQMLHGSSLKLLSSFFFCFL